ncbi:MAG: DNA-directed RNA polymerase subunit alpha [Candidatus Babeliaceae bacterium]
MIKKEYKPLIVPRLSWEKETLTFTHGKLIGQPLEPGFGFTLGNALRRILLGGIEGSAVTSVIIKGINNEFSTLTGVIEDTMQVILNIKGIIVRNKTGKSGTMTLQIKGEKIARIADIKADDHLELINKDHILAHVAEDGILDIEFFVESGRGYQPARWPLGTSLQEDNRIYVDAMFSPVRKITYDVEKTRVGRDIDYDKLIMAIHTDGTETPIAVLNYAVSVLRTQLEHFLSAPEIPFNEISKGLIEEKGEQATPQKSLQSLKNLPLDLLLKPIDVLEFSVRAHNCLIKAGIKRVLDLVNLTEEKLLHIKNFGKRSFDEVIEGLAHHNLSLGMNISESDIKKLQEKESA